MKCDTKRAIKWDLYNKHISIFCIKHMSTTIARCSLTNNSPKTKRFFFFSEYNATKLGSKS